MKNQKILIAKLFTKFDSLRSFDDFIKYYKKNKAGINHELLICYKLLDRKTINFLKKKISKIKHINFIDSNFNNDFDFGSYLRISKKYKNRVIFFMNGHSYPIKTFWLKKIFKKYKKNTFIGTSGSYESLFTNFKLKRMFNIFKLFTFIKDYFFLKKNFNSYPNPHIRTCNFLINSNTLTSFLKNKKIQSKMDSWILESGKLGLSNYLKNKGFKILVVNDDGLSFDEYNWKQSNTYNINNQQKLLVMDKHTKRYLKISKTEKIKFQKKMWH